MRFRDLITESKKPVMEKAEARIQHLEDMVLFGGSKGARKALDTLEHMESNPNSITVKWDGSPAVIFGRNERGEFILTDKAGFSSKSYDGMTKSPEALMNMLGNRGKEAPDEKRQAFIQNMGNVFKVFESAVPENFRGYMWGDLLYYTTPQVDDGDFVFKPQMVVYRVKTDSDIGKRIARSTAGVVVHFYLDLDGTRQRADASMLNEGSLLVMPPVTAQQPPKIDKSVFSQAESLLQKNGAGIDKILDPDTITALKLSDLSNIFYTYMNFKTRTRSLDNLAKEFVDWLSGSKVSGVKQERIKQHIGSEAVAFQGMWDLVTAIMKAKNDVIQQLDSQDADVEAYTDGERGGEGYVIGNGDAKLVNRSGFSAANLNKVK
jgi:hypothetical protein